MGSKRVDHWTSGTVQCVHMWMQWDCRLSTSNCLGSWWSCTTPWAIPVAGRARTSDNGETVPVTSRGGHAQLFFWFRNRNSATCRKNFHNHNSATFKEMLLHNCNFAIPQSQFFLMSATSSPQLESFISAIFDIFLAVESSRIIEKKIGDNKFRATVPLRQVWVPEKQTVLKIFLVDFKNHPELRKRYQKVAELAGDCGELRNCGSLILKVSSRNCATFFSPQLRNRFGCPQYCGVAEVRT
jgi:hypothetical protein